MKSSILLDRDIFRNSVFSRDNNQCVICKKPAVDAHHIMERRLFDDGGYYLENGASLCANHHLEAETTNLSCEEIREAAGISKIILPSHLYEDERYDKWGNIIMGAGKNARRMRGELFHDESVQKALKIGGFLSLFTKYVKYPRTYHLPWSEGLDKDDRMMDSIDDLRHKDVVVMVKLDGENTTMYNDYIHARSLDSKSDATRHWIINKHAQIKHDIPEGWRISCENLYAKHTIKYCNSSWVKNNTYGIVFRIWDQNNNCLSWQSTKEWAELLDFPTCPVLYEGKFDENILREIYQPVFDGDEMEGYVIWPQESFHYRDYRKLVGKFVSKSFKDRLTNSHGHWHHSAIERNGS